MEKAFGETLPKRSNSADSSTLFLHPSIFIFGRFRYAGYCTDPDEIVIEGNLEEMNFAALYVKNDQVRSLLKMHNSNSTK